MCPGFCLKLAALSRAACECHRRLLEKLLVEGSREAGTMLCHVHVHPIYIPCTSHPYPIRIPSMHWIALSVRMIPPQDVILYMAGWAKAERTRTITDLSWYQWEIWEIWWLWVMIVKLNDIDSFDSTSSTWKSWNVGHDATICHNPGVSAGFGGASGAFDQLGQELSVTVSDSDRLTGRITGCGNWNTSEVSKESSDVKGCQGMSRGGGSLEHGRLARLCVVFWIAWTWAMWLVCRSWHVAHARLWLITFLRSLDRVHGTCCRWIEFPQVQKGNNSCQSTSLLRRPHVPMPQCSPPPPVP